MKRLFFLLSFGLFCVATVFAQKSIKVGQIINGKAAFTIKETEVVAALSTFVKDGTISNPVLMQGSDEQGTFYYVTVNKKKGDGTVRTAIILVVTSTDLWAAAEGCEMSCESSTCSCTQNVIVRCKSQTCTCTTSGGCDSKIVLFSQGIDSKN